MKATGFLRVFLTCLVLATVGAAADADIHPRSVLLLHSYNIGYTWTDRIDEGIRSIFQDYDPSIEIHVEYLDTKRYPLDWTRSDLSGLMSRKYEGMSFDVIIVSDDDALTFLLENRSRMFPSVPVIFCGINNIDTRVLPADGLITGIAEDFDLRANLDLFIRLHPQLTTVAVVVDDTPTGRYNLQRLRAIEPEYRERLRFLVLRDYTVAWLSRALADLPPDSVVLNLGFWQDAAGNVLNLQQSVSYLTRHARVPVYTPWDHMIGHGTVGGIVLEAFDHGASAARYATRILDGVAPSDLPILRNPPKRPIFDYTALKRFGISARLLPPDSRILDEPQGFFYRYRSLLVPVLVVIILQAVTNILLWLNMRKRKRAEQAAMESVQEREVLLKEVHHRVKNNLQIVSSLLRLQGGENRDPKLQQLLEDSQNRIRSMAIVHEQLYQSERFSSIRIRDYIEALIRYLAASVSRNRLALQFRSEIDDLGLDIDTAITCGLILNELVSNSIKHAFPDRSEGTITVRFACREEGRYLLAVEDDGVGMGDVRPDAPGTGTLGLNLLHALVQQLSGTVEHFGDREGGGTRCEIIFSPEPQPGKSAGGRRLGEGIIPAVAVGTAAGGKVSRTRRPGRSRRV